MSHPRLTANGTADLDRLTDMIHTLLPLAWGEDWGTFSEEFPTDNDAEKAPMPHITCNLVHREHTENKTRKWTPFGMEPDPLYKGETIQHKKSWFTCTVEFTIYDDTNKGARKLAEKFEEFMETYIGYFKREGISEIIFQEELAPGMNVDYRQDLPHRTLRYEVRIERTFTISSHNMKQMDIMLNSVELETTVQHPSGNTDTYESVMTQDDPVRTHLGDTSFLDLYKQHYDFPK